MATQYLVGSYGSRYGGDPVCTFVARVPRVPHKAGDDAVKGLIAAIEHTTECAMQFDRRDYPSYCTDDECDGSCTLCDPDLVTWGVDQIGAADLFTFQELRAHRRDLVDGQIIVLYR